MEGSLTPYTEWPSSIEIPSPTNCMAIYWHPDCDHHNTGESHPETSSRTRSMIQMIRTYVDSVSPQNPTPSKGFASSNQSRASALMNVVYDKKSSKPTKGVQNAGSSSPSPSADKITRPSISMVHSPAVTPQQVMRFHTPTFWKKLDTKFTEIEEKYNQTREPLKHFIDGDTILSHLSKSAVLHSAGATVAAVDAVLGRDGAPPTADTAFCVVRPPGHHASPDTSSGFCILNNVGIAVKHALEAHNLKRVAVIDFDVHHGNGTEDGLKSDDRCFFGSTHLKFGYPGTGLEPEYIMEEAKTELDRRVVNRQLSDGWVSRLEFHEKWAQILSEMERFRPEMIFISAGFDAHDEDPLADVRLIEEDYDWATREVFLSGLRINFENPPPIVSVTEGGYHIISVSICADRHARMLHAGYESVREVIVQERLAEDGGAAMRLQEKNRMMDIVSKFVEEQTKLELGEDADPVSEKVASDNVTEAIKSMENLSV